MKNWIVTINYSKSVNDFYACVPVLARDEEEAHEQAKRRLKEKIGTFMVNRIISFEVPV